MMTADQVKKMLALEPLPGEGGFYRETWRSSHAISEQLPAGYDGPRSFGTAIYYFLTPETCSALHRLPGDEVFHFYLGDPVEMLQLHPDGRGEIVALGHDLAGGEISQVVVPGGTWQGSRLVLGGAWALLGTTMAPGFDFADYTGGDRAELLAAYPRHGELIEALTPD